MMNELSIVTRIRGTGMHGLKSTSGVKRYGGADVSVSLSRAATRPQRVKVFLEESEPTQAFSRQQVVWSKTPSVVKKKRIVQYVGKRGC
jgi:hypothetical protein